MVAKTVCLYFCIIRENESACHFFREKPFTLGTLLVFGRETQGLPEEILALYADRCYTIPMTNPHIRSLNLAMSAGIVLYEALRQQSI